MSVEMMPDLLIGLYWGPRREDVAAFSKGLWPLLQSFKARPEGPWRSRAGDAAMSEPSDLTTLLTAGVAKGDFGSGPMEELGWYATLLSGRGTSTVEASIHVGSIVPEAGNHLVVRLPVKDVATFELRGLNAAFVALCGLVRPDHGYVLPYDLFDEQRAQGRHVPDDIVGWVTYRSTRPRAVPEDWDVRPAGDGCVVEAAQTWDSELSDRVLASTVL